jgi:hypothetical protein
MIRPGLTVPFAALALPLAGQVATLGVLRI